MYANSSLVIMIVASHLQSAVLKPLGDTLDDINAIIDHIYFTHVYRELKVNTVADKLSKEGLHI